MSDKLILQRYRPLRVLGQGGYATVTMAWDERIQRQVAIKMIALDGVRASQLRMESRDEPAIPGLQEARTAALLDDPHIVGVYDFELADGYAYIIMECMDGITLTELMRSHADAIDLNVIATISESLAAALEQAHRNNVLHLDIKPDNILINSAGEVKVVDFGLASLSQQGEHGAAVGGTISYMPPEQMQGKHLDERCDEWAFAAVLYELIAGTNPFRAKNLEDAERIIYEAELVYPSLCREGLHEQFDDALFRALDPDREERFDTVPDFAYHIKPFLGNARTGKKLLRALIQGEEDQEETQEIDLEPTSSSWFTGAFELPRIQARSMLKLWIAANTGILAWISANSLDMLAGQSNPLFWVYVLGLVSVSLIVPSAGVLIALIGFALVLASHGALVFACALLVGLVLWWLFIGIGSWNYHACLLIPVIVGGLGFGIVLPFIAGALFEKRSTALWSLGAGLLLALGLAGLGSHSLLYWNIFGIASLAQGPWDIYGQLIACLSQPATWCYVISATLSCFVIALSAERESVLWGVLGIIWAVLFLVAGRVASLWLSSGGLLYIPDTLFLTEVIIGALFAGIILFYTPKHERTTSDEAPFDWDEQ